MKNKFVYGLVTFIVLILVQQNVIANQEREFYGFLKFHSQSPLQQLRCGIQPHFPWVVPAKTYSLNIQHNWKNMWLYDEGVSLIDAEIHELSIGSSVGLGKGTGLFMEVPIRYVTGGFLDGFIEGFHRTFGIGNAGRDSFPRDEFAFEIRNGKGVDGWSRADDKQLGWNLGNIIVGTSIMFFSSNEKLPRTVASICLKLPTGTRKEYFGGQSVDIGFSLSSGFRTGRFYWYISPSTAYYGDKEMIGVKLRQWHYGIFLGLEYHRQNSNHSWILQLLAESGIAEDFYQFSESTYEITIGYKRKLSDRVFLEIGLLENLFIFDNSPDVGLHTAITWTNRL